MKQKEPNTIKPKVRKKLPVPTFLNREEEAAFWQQHSSEDFLWDDLPEPVEVDTTLKERVRQRANRRHSRLSHARAAR
jgi:hypothetical protein